jgi:hypothetical protein
MAYPSEKQVNPFGEAFSYVDGGQEIQTPKFALLLSIVMKGCARVLPQADVVSRLNSLI